MLFKKGGENMNTETLSKKGALAAIVGISMLVGATGGTILKAGAANAQSTTPVVTTTPAANNSLGSGSISSTTQGTFKSNEDPTHEAKESAAWEAQETAGKAPWQQSGNTTQ